MNKPTRRSPDYLMRASWHDYRRPGAYLLTLAAAELAGPFSSVLSDETVSLSPVGIVIDRAIRELPELFAGVQIPAYVIMPDHVHLVLRKVRMSPVSVGMVVAKLKSLVTQRIGTPQFAKGFNDKISFSKAQTAAFVCYVRDNPRRFRLRRLNPDYFVSRHTVEFGNQTLLSFGNPELLKHPVKCAVRYSRSYSAAEFKSKIEEWDEVIRQVGCCALRLFMSRSVRFSIGQSIPAPQLFSFSIADFRKDISPAASSLSYVPGGVCLLLLLMSIPPGDGS